MPGRLGDMDRRVLSGFDVESSGRGGQFCGYHVGSISALGTVIGLLPYTIARDRTRTDVFSVDRGTLYVIVLAPLSIKSNHERQGNRAFALTCTTVLYTHFTCRRTYDAYKSIKKWT